MGERDDEAAAVPASRRKVPARVSRSLSRAVAGGDRKAILKALAFRLARELEEAGSREVAPLSARLMETLAALEEMNPGDPARKPAATPTEQFADEVAAKRNRRRRAAG